MPTGRAVMDLAYGDQWGNMLQPFWALPLLGIHRPAGARHHGLHAWRSCCWPRRCSRWCSVHVSGAAGWEPAAQAGRHVALRARPRRAGRGREWLVPGVAGSRVTAPRGPRSARRTGASRCRPRCRPGTLARSAEPQHPAFRRGPDTRTCPRPIRIATTKRSMSSRRTERRRARGSLPLDPRAWSRAADRPARRRLGLAAPRAAGHDRRAAGTQAPPPAAGNLLGDGLVPSRPRTRARPSPSGPCRDDAPAGFEVSAVGRARRRAGRGRAPRRGRLVPAAVGEAGAAGRAPRRASSSSAWSGTPDRGARAALRGRRASTAIERVVAAARASLEGAALVPPGATARARRAAGRGRGARGRRLARARRRAAAAGEERLERGAFQVLARGAHLLVFRGDELVLEAPGPARPRSAPGVGAAARWSRAARRRRRRAGAARRRPRKQRRRAQDRRRALTRARDALRPARRRAAGAHAARGRLAGARRRSASSRPPASRSFTGDFTVPGVHSLVLGHTQDRLVIELDRVRPVRHAPGRRPLAAARGVARGRRPTRHARAAHELPGRARGRRAAPRRPRWPPSRPGSLGEALARGRTWWSRSTRRTRRCWPPPPPCAAG